MNEHFDLTYKSLFRRYYTNLLFYATRIVGEEDAEDVVQDVFVELWKRKDTMKVGEQIQAFLYRAVYTRALNVLKHRDIVSGYEAVMLEIHKKRVEFYQPDSNDVVKRIEDAELRRKLSDECDAKKAEYDTAHAQTDHLYNEWQQERDRYFCVYCFKPMFLDVLVERLHGIAGSILSDINRMKEGKP